eukprot:315511-Amphidinium_carterae.2
MANGTPRSSVHLCAHPGQDALSAHETVYRRNLSAEWKVDHNSERGAPERTHFVLNRDCVALSSSCEAILDHYTIMGSSASSEGLWASFRHSAQQPTLMVGADLPLGELLWAEFGQLASNYKPYFSCKGELASMTQSA